jgi:hypothetical protein
VLIETKLKLARFKMETNRKQTALVLKNAQRRAALSRGGAGSTAIVY